MRRLVLARYWLFCGFIMMSVVLVSLLLPQVDVTVPGWLGDKAQHALAFAGLTGWYCGVFERRYFVRIVIAMIVFAVATELMQAFLTVSRHGDFHDLLADFLGIGAAIGVACLGLDQWAMWIERIFGLEYRRTD